MKQFYLGGQANCLYYVSSKCRSWIPAKTILIFAPDRVACCSEKLEQFAIRSGWISAAEQDGAVLVLPIAQDGWKSETTGRIKPLYRGVWKDTLSPDPSEVFRNVWCWETLIFAVGYEEGAEFAGLAAIEQPNTFAQAVMVGGGPEDFSGGEALSDRWLVPDASHDWQYKNCQVPIAVWFIGRQDTAEAEAYFAKSAMSPNQVKHTVEDTQPTPELTGKIMREFETRIRWKNSPDGTPARLKPETELLATGEYVLETAVWNGYPYRCYVRTPANRGESLPLVLCLHGHGEPAWMFAQKNGWPELQDELGSFIFACPDSPFNSWEVYRDEGMLPLLLKKLEKRFNIDPCRVYLTGFSNGAMATCWYGTRHPELFAALAPWNSALRSYEDHMVDMGWEMPVFAVNGDMDHKMDLPRKQYPELFASFIRAGGGVPTAEKDARWGLKCQELWDDKNRYTRDAGYMQGNRLTTYVYHNREEKPCFCFTEVKDMPHGAIADEARATWAFVSRFSRPLGSKSVEGK